MNIRSIIFSFLIITLCAPSRASCQRYVAQDLIDWINSNSPSKIIELNGVTRNVLSSASMTNSFVSIKYEYRSYAGTLPLGTSTTIVNFDIRDLNPVATISGASDPSGGTTVTIRTRTGKYLIHRYSSSCPSSGPCELLTATSSDLIETTLWFNSVDAAQRFAEILRVVGKN